MATTTSHLYERIYEVLVDGAGASRSLSASDRFARLRTNTADNRDLAIRAKVKPIVNVIISPLEPLEGDADELYDLHGYQITVTLVRYYFLGFDSDPSGVEATLVRYSDDYMRVRAALCYPGNLQTTEAGVATGSSGLRPGGRGGGSKVNLESIQNGRDRLLRAVDTFTGHFDFDPQSYLLTEAGGVLLAEDGSRLLLE